MENPDFIKKVLAYYDEPLKPVPGVEVRYLSRTDTKLKFRDRNNVNFTVAIHLLDLARTRHEKDGRIKWLWVRYYGNTHNDTCKLLKALIAQFP